jgi:hypothetical protein
MPKLEVCHHCRKYAESTATSQQQKKPHKEEKKISRLYKTYKKFFLWFDWFLSISSFYWFASLRTGRRRDGPQVRKFFNIRLP